MFQVELAGTGVQCLAIEAASGGVDLGLLLDELGRCELNEVQVEAGSRLCGSLLRQGLVDEVLLYLAPCLVGHAASGLFNLPELTSLEGKRRLQIRDLRQIGEDIRLIARFP